MGERLFIGALNMSLTGSLVILAVLVIRLFLRRVPRIFSYCLWGVVLFRLLCPVSFSAGFSLLGALEQPSAQQGRMAYIPENLAVPGGQPGRLQEAGGSSLAEGAGIGEGTGPEDAMTGSRDRERSWSGDGMYLAVWAGARIWILGICAMAGYSLLTLAGLKRKLRGARREEGDFYVTKEVSTPFVLGLVRPRIYLPEGLGEREKTYVLLHEQIHVKRRDHVVKMLFFLALCIHWFNPFVWVAFFLGEKDMEMSCDEAVIRRIGSSVKKEYTASLLGMATGRHMVNGIPLAFGEGDTGSRIKNVLRYQKPAAMAVAAAAVGCAAVALALMANPAKARGEELASRKVYFGVVKGDEGEYLVIPGIGAVGIPEADSISTYFEREEQELLPGDLVRVTFQEETPVQMDEEHFLGQFAQRAESMVVMWGGCFLEPAQPGTREYWENYRQPSLQFTFPAGIVPGSETAAAGDLLSVYWEEGDPEAPAYLSWVPEGENSALVAQAPLLGVGEFPDGIRMLTVELTAEQIQRVFEGFGFHIRFALEQVSAARQDGQADDMWAGTRDAGDAGRPGAGSSGGESNGTGSTSVEAMNKGNEAFVENPEELPSFWKGTRRIYVNSVSRSARVIDSYLFAGGASRNEPELAFSEDCVFRANYSMVGADYREITFDEFADFIAAGRRPYGRKPVEKSCQLTFQDGLVVEAALDSIWYPYGIGFSTYTLQNYRYGYLTAHEGTETLEQKYTLDSVETVDISDREGLETIEVYVGNLGDGDSGIVLCRDAQGNLLSSQDAHVTRTGWNNIYVGETEEGAFLLNVSIEDRWYSGEYGYWVYRLDEEGELRQIAGSTFTFDIMENSFTEYDDDLFKEWVDDMTAWLADSHLLLSTQGGELRTEKICEADRYCYGTLGLKDRLEE